MQIIYFLVSLISTILGSAAGIGGGVIIKPVLDFLGNYNLSTINLLSSFAVFSMATVSIIKQILYKTKIRFKETVFLAIGSIMGGYAGQKLLGALLTSPIPSNIINIIQSTILIVLLIFVYFYMNNKNKFKSFNINNLFLCIIIGLSLGILAAFLGIGGGPINVAILTIFFSMEAKDASVNSIVIILFSQGAKILTVALGSGFAPYNLSMLGYMIIGGILGGLIGTRLNKFFTNNLIIKIFNYVVLFIIFLNIYNIYTAIK